MRRKPAENSLRARRSRDATDRKSTRLNSSHSQISYAVFCLKKKTRETVGPGAGIRARKPATVVVSPTDPRQATGRNQTPVSSNAAAAAAGRWPRLLQDHVLT